MARILDTAKLEWGNKYEGRPLTPNESDWCYNGLDCCVTLEVANVLLQQLDNTTAQTYQFSRDLMGPILEMTTRGILVDQARRNSVLREYKHQIANIGGQLDAIIREGIGLPEFNWRSSTQLKRLFYEVLDLPAIRKRNANGIMAPTVNREALEKLASYFIAEPITNRLLLLRDVDRKRSFLETGIDNDGRMRANFNIAGTNSGRLASSMSDFGTGTNLQNVDRELRSVFISDPGKIFINLDLEQGDSRNLGALCWEYFVEQHGEKFAGAYLDACESGDLHTRVSMMSRPHLPWTSDMKANRKIADQLYYRQDSYRQLDKKLGHGSNYLGQPKTMARHARVPIQEVETFQKNYFKAFGCIPAYHQYVRDELKEVGYLTTPFGRRRKFFGRYNDEATVREAVAYRPQSMTAEEINLGMLALFRTQKVEMLCQVHDSLLFQCAETDVDKVVPMALELTRIHLPLTRGRDFVVPSEAKIGYNWGDFSEENPNGLTKWKGTNDRKRIETPKLSIKSFL